MEFNIEPFLSAVTWRDIAAAFGCYAIGKVLGDLERLNEKLQKLCENQAGVSAHLEQLREHDTTIKEHTKKIAYLEGACGDNRHSQGTIQ